METETENIADIAKQSEPEPEVNKDFSSQHDPSTAAEDELMATNATQVEPVTQQSEETQATATATKQKRRSTTEKVNQKQQTTLTSFPDDTADLISEPPSMLQRGKSRGDSLKLSNLQSRTYGILKDGSKSTVRDMSVNVQPIIDEEEEGGTEADDESVMDPPPKPGVYSKGKLGKAPLISSSNVTFSSWITDDGKKGVERAEWGGEGEEEWVEPVGDDPISTVELEDAMTLARPIGYRELNLWPRANPGDAENDKEIQVEEKEIEVTSALFRGVVLDPYNILWPTNGEFSILSAERHIEKYVTRCWKMCGRWAFSVKFLQSQASCYKNKYIFEVKWSLPTKENPIPMACASVFFVFDVEIYGGRDEPVRVHYVLEGTRFPHKPGETPFEQKWISNIICEKMRLSRSAC